MLPACRLFLLLSILLTLTAPLRLTALAQEPDPQALHSRIIEASGFDQALTDVWLSIEQSIIETNVNPQQRSTLQRWLSRSFGADVLLQDFRSGLTRQLNPALAQEVTRFLDSPAGQHILQTEASQVNATDEELQDFSDSFDPNSRQNRSRVELTLQILESTRTLDNTVLILHSIYSNVMRAVQAVNAPDGRGLSDEDFAYTSALIRTQLENQMREYVLLNMLFTYRDIEISYLESYAAYLNSPAGLWYTQALHNILEEVLGNAGTRLKVEIHATDG